VTRRIVILIVLAALLFVVVGRFAWMRRQETSNTKPTVAGLDLSRAPGASRQQGSEASGPIATAPVVAAKEPETRSARWIDLLLDGDENQSALPRELIERYLASGATNAEDLLAARQAGGGVEFLKMALERFPNDPRVLFASLSQKEDPALWRERLERLKAAAPGNALPDYVSARDHFKNSRPEEGFADLMAAAGKSTFNDYTLDAVQNTEDLYLHAGKSPGEAKALATSSALLPHLAEMKGLSQELAKLERQYLGAGDSESAERLAALGVQLSHRLETGDGSHTLIGQLVGIASERIVLNPLEGERSYDFLQGSPKERLDALTALRTTLRSDMSFVTPWMRTASESQLNSYFERLKLYGEANAMAWARQHPQ
jgi:hypothetical protein